MKRRSLPPASGFLTRGPVASSVVEPALVVEPATPTVAASPAVDVAVAEVLEFPIRWLRQLPLPSSLRCSFADGGGCVLLCTSVASRAPGVTDPPCAPAFVGPEVDALALAAEHDRATPRQWVARKLADPTWRLTSREVGGGLAGHPQPLGWTTQRVLRALGLRLDEVWL